MRGVGRMLVGGVPDEDLVDPQKLVGPHGKPGSTTSDGIGIF